MIERPRHGIARPGKLVPEPRPERFARSCCRKECLQSAGACGRVLTSAEVPPESRSRVDVQMSPPATGVVATTALPSSFSARLAIVPIRATSVAAQLAAERVDDRVAGALDGGEHVLEAVVPAGVGIGHVPVPSGRPRVEVAEHPQALGAAFGELAQVGVVVLVHREDEVVLLVPVRLELRGTVLRPVVPGGRFVRVRAT